MVFTNVSMFIPVTSLAEVSISTGGAAMIKGQVVSCASIRIPVCLEHGDIERLEGTYHNQPGQSSSFWHQSSALHRPPLACPSATDILLDTNALPLQLEDCGLMSTLAP